MDHNPVSDEIHGGVRQGIIARVTGLFSGAGCLVPELYIMGCADGKPGRVELVQEGVTPSHPYYERLLEWNGGREDFRRWKANINGVDLGDQFLHIGMRKLREGENLSIPAGLCGD